MENATKALMIAGAVLIAIMIIGIGMMIYQSASGTINDAMGSVDQIAIDTFNGDLIGYEGTQKGTQVKALITKVITLNSTNNEAHPERLLTVNVLGTAIAPGTDVSAQISSLSTARAQNIVAGRTYNVSFDYATTGYISTITITDPNA